MKEKIFNALKTKYSSLGFNKEVLEGVATQLSTYVTEEDKIATAVEGAESMLKSFQSFADSRVNSFKSESKKNKTEAEKLRARLAELEKQEPNPNPQEGDDVLKQIQKTMEEMQNTIQGFQSANTSQSMRDTFIGKMKELEVPEHFYKNALIGREFSEKTNIDEFAESVSKNYDEFKQNSANLGFSYTKPPENPAPPEKEGEELAKQIREGTKEIVEQKNNN